MTSEQRYAKIVEQYNTWLDQYVEASDSGDWEVCGYYAFMLNSITAGVIISHDQGLKRYFYSNAANRHGVKYFDGADIAIEEV